MATLTCTWDGVNNVDGYNVYIKKDSGPYEKVNTNLITSTQFIIGNVEEGNYEGYATAVRGDQESPRSNSRKITVGVSVIDPDPLKLFTHSEDVNDGDQLQSLIRVFDMGNGTYRMYWRTFEWGVGYKKLFYMTSFDGVNWDYTNRIEVDVSNLEGNDGIRLIPHRTTSGTWRGIYPTEGSIKSATSSDGITWTDGTVIRENIKDDGFHSFVRNGDASNYFIYGRVRGNSGSGSYTQYAGSDAYPDHQYRRGIAIHKSSTWNGNYDGDILFDPAVEFNYAPQPATGEVDTGEVRMDIHEMNAIEYTASSGTNYILGFPSIMFQNSKRNQLRGTHNPGSTTSDPDFSVKFLDRDDPVGRLSGGTFTNYEKPNGDPYNPWWIGNGETYPVALKSTDGINFTWVGLDIQNPMNTISPIDLGPFTRVLPDPSPYSFPTSSNINDTENLYKRDTVGWVRIRDIVKVGNEVFIYMDVADNYHDEAKEFGFFNNFGVTTPDIPTAERTIWVQKMPISEFEYNLELINE